MNDARGHRFPWLAGRATGIAGACVLACAMLSGCGGAIEYKPQQWHGMNVVVESRPNPPREGMNEFLVTITDKHGRPGFDMIVSLRASERDPWTQAIQDGQMGVYRRAVKVDPATDKVLEVQLEANGKADVLDFPFAPH